MDFLEKLDFLMDRFGLTKTSLSQKSEIPYTTIDAWYKKGYEGLKLTTLRKLARYFNTTLDYWFIDEITDPNYGKTSGFKVDYDEMEHIKKYRSLDNSGRERIDYELARELERVTQIREMETSSHDKDERIIDLEERLVPRRIFSYHGKIAAAGTSYGFDDITSGTIEVPLDKADESADYTIGVSGDSMEPTYYDGDIVYVQKATHLDVGDVGIFQKDNCIYIKEVGENGLLSHNENYKPMTNGGDVICLGKVLGRVEE